MPMPKLQTVSSTKVFQIGYDAEDKTLYVRFTPTKHHPAGRIAAYSGVSQQDAERVASADSIGGALKDFIEGAYSFTYL
jgi:KTSC domain